MYTLTGNIKKTMTYRHKRYLDEGYLSVIGLRYEGKIAHKYVQVHMFMCKKYDGICFYDVIKGEKDSILSLPTEISKFAKEI